MDTFTITTVWFFSIVFGAWTGLAVAQAITGRSIFPSFVRVSRTPRELKQSGWGWAVCGAAGAITELVGGLIFGAHVIPVFWVGSPWGIFANPWPFVLGGTLLFQFMIDQRHKGRWPFRRFSPPS